MFYRCNHIKTWKVPNICPLMSLLTFTRQAMSARTAPGDLMSPMGRRSVLISSNKTLEKPKGGSRKVDALFYITIKHNKQKHNLTFDASLGHFTTYYIMWSHDLCHVTFGRRISVL